MKQKNTKCRKNFCVMIYNLQLVDTVARNGIHIQMHIIYSNESTISKELWCYVMFQINETKRNDLNGTNLILSESLEVDNWKPSFLFYSHFYYISFCWCCFLFIVVVEHGFFCCCMFYDVIRTTENIWHGIQFSMQSCFFSVCKIWKFVSPNL